MLSTTLAATTDRTNVAGFAALGTVRFFEGDLLALGE
jgi:hypothetical protein